MSNTNPKEGEIIPPNAVTRVEESAVQRVDNMPDNNPEGVLDSAVTAFVAGLRRRANSALAANANARADYHDAVKRVAKTYIGMHQALDEAGELKVILELDRQERNAERNERAEEITHRKTISEQRRKQEQIEAQRGVFNAEQGLENQKRVKEINLETWENRKKVEQLDSAALLARLRGETDLKKKQGGDLLSVLQEQLAKIDKKIDEAGADGKDTTVDRMVRSEIDALILRLCGK
jgi:hypothetical protein